MNRKEIQKAFANYFQLKVGLDSDGRVFGGLNEDKSNRDIRPNEALLANRGCNSTESPASSPLPCQSVGCPLSNDRRELTAKTLFWAPSGWSSEDAHRGSIIQSLVSSRLGARLKHDLQIANAIRNFLILSDSNDIVVTAAETTMYEVLQRGCQIFDRKLLRLIPFPNEVTQQWIEATLTSSNRTSRYRQTTVYFDSDSISGDELTFSLSDTVKVADLRRGGNIHKLINRFLRFETGEKNQNAKGSLALLRTAHRIGPKIMIRTTSNRGTDKLHRGLLDAGCIAWHLYQGESNPNETGSEPPPNRILRPGELKGDFLNHWTRADRRAWPDQSELNQFDQMLLGQSPSETTPRALGTLCRILSQRKLLASGRLIPEGHRVVSLTEIPLNQFAKRRVFRPQLSRWDFEPFGIAIHKSVIQNLGGRSVRYVSEAEFAETSAHQPPKTRFTVVNHVDSKVDWSEEREWRVVGDIDLRHLGPENAAVFVPDMASARVVAGFCNWPIVLMNEPPESDSVS